MSFRVVGSLWAVSLLIALATVVQLSAGFKPPELNPIRVDPDTGYFKDDHGRIRLFHGINAVFKEPPYHPVIAKNGTGVCKADTRFSMCPEEIAQLHKEWGFNAVRLGVLWNAVQPDEGVIDHDYLSVMKDLVEQLASNGIYTIIDAHQDAMGSLFCGEGVPSFVISKALELAKWNTSDIKKQKVAFPWPFPFNISVDPKTGYPNSTDCRKNNFIEYYFTLESSTAWQSLYDQPALWNYFGESWAAVANTFSSVDKVLAYELINEPPPGSLYDFWKHPLHPTELLSDQKNLAPMYQALNEHIRAKDNNTVILFESVVFDTYMGLLPGRQESDFKQGPGGSSYMDRQAYAYHLYCQNDAQGKPAPSVSFCKALLTETYKKVMPTLKRLHTGGFLTEMGAAGQDPESLDLLQSVLSTADEHLQSWAYWTYKDFYDITTENSATETFFNGDGSLQLPKVKALTRTYALAIAGQPIAMRFDPTTAQFDLEYIFGSDDAASKVVMEPTVVYMNEDMYYPHGFNVSIASSLPGVSWHKTTKNYIEVHHPGLIATGGAHDVAIVITALTNGVHLDSNASRTHQKL